MDCKSSTVFLLDRESKELYTQQGTGVDVVRVPMTAGLVGHVVSTLERANVKDIRQCDMFHPEVDTASGYRTQSILCMPLTAPTGEVMGAIQAINKNTHAGTFDDADEDMLRVFSDQARVRATPHT